MPSTGRFCKSIPVGRCLLKVKAFREPPLAFHLCDIGSVSRFSGRVELIQIKTGNAFELREGIAGMESGQGGVGADFGQIASGNRFERRRVALEYFIKRFF
jgi:hypothetical protein